jgi:hypothetical protein
LQAFTPQNISNLLWATAKMGYRHDSLLQTAAHYIARQLASSSSASNSSDSGQGGGADSIITATSGSGPAGSWTGHEVASTSWAYASLGVNPGEQYMQQVGRGIRERLSNDKRVL